MGARVILTTVFPVGQVPIERRPFWSEDVAIAVDEVNAFIHSLAGGRVTILDTYSVLVEDNGSTKPEYSEDLLHLAPTGYELLNRELVPLLRAWE